MFLFLEVYNLHISQRSPIQPYVHPPGQFPVSIEQEPPPLQWPHWIAQSVHIYTVHILTKKSKRSLNTVLLYSISHRRSGDLSIGLLLSFLLSYVFKQVYTCKVYLVLLVQLGSIQWSWHPFGHTPDVVLHAARALHFPHLF